MKTRLWFNQWNLGPKKHCGLDEMNVWFLSYGGQLQLKYDFISQAEIIRTCFHLAVW